jgi:hypothetical protein
MKNGAESQKAPFREPVDSYALAGVGCICRRCSVILPHSSEREQPPRPDEIPTTPRGDRCIRGCTPANAETRCRTINPSLPENRQNVRRVSLAEVPVETRVAIVQKGPIWNFNLAWPVAVSEQTGVLPPFNPERLKSKGSRPRALSDSYTGPMGGLCP